MPLLLVPEELNSPHRLLYQYPQPLRSLVIYLEGDEGDSSGDTGDTGKSGQEGERQA